MKIYYYKATPGNFGDELNPMIFNHFLPNMLDGEAWHVRSQPEYLPTDVLLIGIGTLLNQAIPNQNKKLVFSTGAGYGNFQPLKNTKVFCVRGPLTAEKYSLDKRLAITDGAALLSRMISPMPEKRYKRSFMPHYSTAICGDWRWVCKMLDINYIDPCSDVRSVIDEICATEVLYTEAMHGAIVADTFRVPWVPIKTSNEILDFKWLDWAGSLNLDVHFRKLPSIWKSNALFNRARGSVKKILALNRLNSIVKSNFETLSEDSIFNERVDRLEEAIIELRSENPSNRP